VSRHNHAGWEIGSFSAQSTDAPHQGVSRAQQVRPEECVRKPVKRPKARCPVSVLPLRIAARPPLRAIIITDVVDMTYCGKQKIERSQCFSDATRGSSGVSECLAIISSRVYRTGDISSMCVGVRNFARNRARMSPAEVPSVVFTPIPKAVIDRRRGDLRAASRLAIVLQRLTTSMCAANRDGTATASGPIVASGNCSMFSSLCFRRDYSEQIERRAQGVPGR